MHGSITQLVQRISRGDDSAVETLWHIYWTRLVRRANAVVRSTKVGCQSAEDIAIEVFAEFIQWLRDSAPFFDSRKEVWSQLTMATWKRGLRLRKYERAGCRIKIWGQTNPDPVFESVEADLNEIDDELEEELEYLVQHASEVHSRAGEILALAMDEGKGAPAIAEQLNIPLRTVYRVMANCRSQFRERWNA